MTGEGSIVLAPAMPCDLCGPKSAASRFARCRCQTVIARCSAHGENMERVRNTHCDVARSVVTK